jgi:threonine-phosphate decarboxylase
MIHGHGGNIYELAGELGCDPFEIADMSSNVNPLGPPPELLRHLETRLNRIKALPEADAGCMVAQFAADCGIAADEVLAGNGTTQIIHDLPRALNLREVLIAGPTYADYADACRLNGVACRFELAPETDGFELDLDALRVRIPGADAVYLCNPNNPTGQLITADAVRALCREFPRQHFILDESYLPFVPGCEAHTLIRQRPANALVLHSMSKIFRIPGLRVGFVIGAADVIDRLRRFSRPWSVNSLAQTAVRFLLANPAISRTFIQKTQTFIADERAALISRLDTVPGLQVFPSRTSFFILKLPAPHRSEDVCGHLRSRRVLIRDCSNFEGLSADYIRISLKTPAVNRQCADLLTRYLTG